MSGVLSPVRLPGRPLLGRERERAALDRLLEAATSGHDGVLVVRGEPGVGKTALLEYAIDAGREFRFARTVGVEGGDGVGRTPRSTAVLPDSRAHRSMLPGPQRDALARRVRNRCRAGLRIRSSSGWRSSACCRRRPTNDRSSASSMTRSGSIMPRRGRSRSWLAVCWRRGSRSCSRRASSATPSRDCRSLASNPGASRLASPARVRAAGSAGRARAGSDRPRDAREPARPDGAAAGLDADAAGRWVGCPSRCRCRPASRRASRGDSRGSRRCAALVAGRSGRPGGRSSAGLAGGSTAWNLRIDCRAVESAGFLSFSPRVVFRHPLVRSAVYGVRHATSGERSTAPRRGDRCGDRPGSPRLAPGAGRIPAR